jgi:hypothetical protein
MAHDERASAVQPDLRDCSTPMRQGDFHACPTSVAGLGFHGTSDPRSVSATSLLLDALVGNHLIDERVLHHGDFSSGGEGQQGWTRRVGRQS